MLDAHKCAGKNVRNIDCRQMRANSQKRIEIPLKSSRVLQNTEKKRTRIDMRARRDGGAHDELETSLNSHNPTNIQFDNCDLRVLFNVCPGSYERVLVGVRVCVCSDRPSAEQVSE